MAQHARGWGDEVPMSTIQLRVTTAEHADPEAVAGAVKEAFTEAFRDAYASDDAITLRAMPLPFVTLTRARLGAFGGVCFVAGVVVALLATWACA